MLASITTYLVLLVNKGALEELVTDCKSYSLRLNSKVVCQETVAHRLVEIISTFAAGEFLKVLLCLPLGPAIVGTAQLLLLLQLNDIHLVVG